MTPHLSCASVSIATSLPSHRRFLCLIQTHCYKVVIKLYVSFFYAITAGWLNSGPLKFSCLSLIYLRLSLSSMRWHAVHACDTECSATMTSG